MIYLIHSPNVFINQDSFSTGLYFKRISSKHKTLKNRQKNKFCYTHSPITSFICCSLILFSFYKYARKKFWYVEIRIFH
jgi:hypothetical protein